MMKKTKNYPKMWFLPLPPVIILADFGRSEINF
jgi:hypothetical protein